MLLASVNLAYQWLFEHLHRHKDAILSWQCVEEQATIMKTQKYVSPPSLQDLHGQIGCYAELGASARKVENQLTSGKGPKSVMMSASCGLFSFSNSMPIICIASITTARLWKVLARITSR